VSTPQRDRKRLERRLRYIPVDRIAARVAADERAGMWLEVGGVVQFIPVGRGVCDIGPWLGDPLEWAEIVRYVRSRPERVHQSRESAWDFVESRLGAGQDAEPGAAVDPAPKPGPGG